MRQLTYLACPYSHQNPLIRQARFEAANRAAGNLMARGLMVFSPVSHSHPIAEACDLPKDWEFWREYCLTLLSMAKQVYVLRCLGWTESVGVQAEIAHANEQGIPVFFMDEE